MSEADLENLFPDLRRDGYSITSQKNVRYNCVAWANDEDGIWWDYIVGPGKYWPRGIPRSPGVEAYLALFVAQGYEVAAGPSVEPGYRKLAIFAWPGGRFAHVAKQIASGAWTSKVGKDEDIEHNLLGPLGTKYGSVHCYLRRRDPLPTD